MNILLICFQGISTRVLAKKMEHAAEEKGLEWKVSAAGFYHANEELEHCDIVLLAPQNKMIYEDLKRMCSERGIPCLLIDEDDYYAMEVDVLAEKLLRIMPEGSGAGKAGKRVYVSWKDAAEAYRCFFQENACVLGALLLFVLLLYAAGQENILWKAVLPGCFMGTSLTLGWQFGKACKDDAVSTSVISLLAACFMSVGNESAAEGTVLMQTDFQGFVKMWVVSSVSAVLFLNFKRVSGYSGKAGREVPYLAPFADFLPAAGVFAILSFVRFAALVLSSGLP